MLKTTEVLAVEKSTNETMDIVAPDLLGVERYKAIFVWYNLHLKETGALERASKTANTNPSTFCQWVKKGQYGPIAKGPPPKLTPIVEAKLIEWIELLNSFGFGVTKALVIEQARKLAMILDMDNDEIGGKTWWKLFCRRHPTIIVRKPKLMEIARLIAPTTKNLSYYFELAAKIIKKYEPHQMFNFDESQFCLVAAAEDGRSRVSTITIQLRLHLCKCLYMPISIYIHIYLLQFVSTKKFPNPTVPHEGLQPHVSFGLCGNAEGKIVAPMFIFAGVRHLAKYTEDWPEVNFCMTESGFQTTDTFYSWCELFIKETGGKNLLIVDRHSSRIDVRTLAMLRAAKVEVLCLQPHTTHICQPLDVGAFGPLKAAFNKLVAVSGVKQNVNKYNICKHVREAIAASLKVTEHPLTGEKSSPIITGFRLAGLHPFNPQSVIEKWGPPADRLLEVAEAYRAKIANQLSPGAPITPVNNMGNLRNDGGPADDDMLVDDDDVELHATPHANHVTNDNDATDAAQVNAHPTPTPLQLQLIDEASGLPEGTEARIARVNSVKGRAKGSEILTHLHVIERELVRQEKIISEAEGRALRQANKLAGGGKPKAPKVVKVVKEPVKTDFVVPVVGVKRKSAEENAEERYNVILKTLNPGKVRVSIRYNPNPPIDPDSTSTEEAVILPDYVDYVGFIDEYDKTELTDHVDDDLE